MCLHPVYFADPPPGKYVIWVENNRDRTDGSPCPFTVRLSRGDKIEDKSFDNLQEYEEQPCFEFELEENN